MMDRHIADSICAAVTTAALVSTLVGVGLRVGEARLFRLNPMTQLRWVSAAVWLPSIVSILFVIGACLDYWYAPVIPVGAHAELPPVSKIPVVLIVASCGICAHLGWKAARIYKGILRSHAAHLDLRRIAEPTAGDGLLIPIEEPCAFVIGLVRPEVVVSRGLRASLSDTELEVVLAHERAHAGRRDPLRQLLASIGLLWHIPGIASHLDRKFRLCQELIADRAAVSNRADKQCVANTLVRYARLRPRGLMSTPAFGNSGIAKRVRSLMELDSLERDRLQPVVAALLVAALLALFAGHNLHGALHHFSSLLYRLP
jgi:hypothetical protein